jgi:hypothetical protein
MSRGGGPQLCEPWQCDPRRRRERPGKRIAIPWALVGELAASEVRDPSPDVMPDSSPATIPPGIMVGSLARLSTVRHHAMPAKASG